MVTISDDGMGLDEDFDLITLASNGHYGLLGISERVALLGVDVFIYSTHLRAVRYYWLRFLIRGSYPDN